MSGYDIYSSLLEIISNMFASKFIAKADPYLNAELEYIFYILRCFDACFQVLF